MSGFQLTQPFSGGSGYRPPANLLGDYHLHLDPELTSTRHHWFGQSILGGPPLALWPTLGDLDSGLRPLLGDFSRDMAGDGSVAPQPLLNRLAARLDDDLRRKIAEALRDALQAPLSVRGRTNIASGEPATIGTVRADGTPDYAGVTDVVPGTGLPLRQGLTLLGAGRLFRYNWVPDVEVSLIFDKDAALSGRWGTMLSGASVEIPVRLPGISNGSVTLVGGRDQVGGPAGAFSFGFTWGGPPKR